MNLSPVQQSIKLSMRVINKALKQIPVDKRNMIASRISLVVDKYLSKTSCQDDLKKFNKQLQFNLNFLKLSHPKLDYTPPTEQQINQKQSKQKEQQDNHQNNSQNNSQNNGQNNQKKYKHKFKLSNDQNMQLQRLNCQDNFDRQQQIQKKLKKYQRQVVQFTNWFQGNVDPQSLRKHKQLLQRQHFSGQFWKDKQKPKSIAKQYLKNIISSQVPGQQPPIKNKTLHDYAPDIDQSDQVWDKVKR